MAYVNVTFRTPVWVHSSCGKVQKFNIGSHNIPTELAALPNFSAAQSTKTPSAPGKAPGWYKYSGCEAVSVAGVAQMTVYQRNSTISDIIIAFAGSLPMEIEVTAVPPGIAYVIGNDYVVFNGPTGSGGGSRRISVAARNCRRRYNTSRNIDYTVT